jgi:predicted Zn finger-like uncharacterized protein
MPVTLTCSGCNSSLKVRDDLAGKKVKCPRCAHLIVVPARDEDLTEVLNVPDEGITEVRPNAKARKKPAPDEDEDEEREERVSASKPKAKAKPARSRDEDEEEEEERPKRKKKRSAKDEDGPQYAPCPNCGAEDAKAVKWTPWGSFYGPAMFTHVKCRECGSCYNGKSGRSNIIPIIIFVTVPLLGILGILGGLAYLFYSKGYFG